MKNKKIIWGIVITIFLLITASIVFIIKSADEDIINIKPEEISCIYITSATGEAYELNDIESIKEITLYMNSNTKRLVALEADNDAWDFRMAVYTKGEDDTSFLKETVYIYGHNDEIEVHKGYFVYSMKDFDIELFLKQLR